MKFSIIYEAQMVDTSRESEQRTFHEIIEQSLFAEKMGFDCIWAVEHTALTQYAHMSAPETVLAFIAGATSRIHVGHGVVCLPPAMNHPVKVAERINTLDILSKGRLHFGMGKGGTQQEAGTFGYDLGELQPMIDESMYLIPKIMVQDEIEHDGTYIKIPRRPIHPKPYQDPHPPLYMACTREATLTMAGARGIGALVLGFSGPDEIAKKNAIYREAFATRKPEDQVGFRPTEHLAALCAATVLDDREKARKIGLRGQRFFAESIAHWYQGGPKPTVDRTLPPSSSWRSSSRKSRRPSPICPKNASQSAMSTPRTTPSRRMPTETPRTASATSSGCSIRAPTKSCSCSRWAASRTRRSWKRSATSARRSFRISGGWSRPRRPNERRGVRLAGG